MPRQKRSARGVVLPEPPAPREAVGMPTTEVRHLRCPCCGLWARLDLLAAGPYPIEARTQSFGGSLPSPDGTMGHRPGVMSWTEPEDPTAEELAFIQGKLAELPERGPLAVEGVPAVVPAEAPPPAPGFKPYTSTRATKSTVAKLADHLELLATLPDDTPGLETEMENLVELLAGWQGEAEDSLANEEAKDNPDPNREDMFSNRAEEFGSAHDALEQGEASDLVDAVEHLRAAWSV